MTYGFTPPPYPYELLDNVRSIANSLPGGMVDLSIGTPCDPVPEIIASAMSSKDAVDSARPYPPSIGNDIFLSAISEWFLKILGTKVPQDSIAASIGSKEFVTGLPAILKLRKPSQDTVLYPAISYPSYAMGAELANCRPVGVAVNADWRIDLSSIKKEDAERALCLWVNSPGNPSGVLDDLESVVEWGKENDVIIISDECYLEFTWSDSPKSVLQTGLEGVIAVHSLSKRSNFAGMRVGFYAGDQEIVKYVKEVRKHQGFMLPGPAQIAGAVALSDQKHVEDQRNLYVNRLSKLISIFSSIGIEAEMPEGAFYLWIQTPHGDSWGLIKYLAEKLGMVVTPGEFFGKGGKGHIRVAAVATDDRIELLEKRAGVG